MAGCPIGRSVDLDKPQSTLQARKKPRGEQQERSHAVFRATKRQTVVFGSTLSSAMGRGSNI
jgi:hypothetical protein